MELGEDAFLERVLPLVEVGQVANVELVDAEAAAAGGGRGCRVAHVFDFEQHAHGGRHGDALVNASVSTLLSSITVFIALIHSESTSLSSTSYLLPISSV